MNRFFLSIVFLLACIIAKAQEPQWSDELTGKAEPFVAGFVNGTPVIWQDYPLAGKVTISALQPNNKTFSVLAFPTSKMAGNTFGKTLASKYGIDQVVMEHSKNQTCVNIHRFTESLEFVASFPLYCVPKNEAFVGFGRQIAYSPDSSKILVIHPKRPYSKETNILQYYVFNSVDWSLVHKGSFWSSLLGYAFSDRQAILKNDGSLVLFAKTQRALAELKKGVKNDLIVSQIFVDGTSKENVVQSPILYASSGIFNELSGKVFMAGFKLSLDPEKMAFGYNLVINDIGKITSDTIKPQSNWKLDGLFPPYEPGTKMKNNPQFDPFVIRTFHENADGTFTLTAEQVSNNPNTATTLGKIAIINTKPDGSAKIYLMPRFKTVGDNSTYLTGPYKGGWCVVYDDEVAALPATDWENYMKLTSTVNFTNKDQGLVLWHIDADGNSTKKLIYAFKDAPAAELHRSRILRNGNILLATKKSFGWLKLN